MNSLDLKELSQVIVDKLKPIQDSITSLARKIDHPELGLGAVNEKADILVAEMHEVKKLTKATNELVRINREVIDEELKNIRKHVGLIP